MGKGKTHTTGGSTAAFFPAGETDGRDWPPPKAVITYDTLSQTPGTWVIDDNGGAGYTSPAARRRLAELPPLQGGGCAIRRKDTLRYRNRFV